MSALGRMAGRIGPPVAAAALVVAVWEVTVRALSVPRYALPPPSAVVVAFGEVRPILGPHVRATMALAAGGLALGTVVGAAVAGLLAGSPLVARAVQPLLVASQSVPSVVLAPILISLWGLGTGSRVAVVSLVAVFPVAVATLDGLRRPDPELLGLVRSMGAGRWRQMVWVRVPNAVEPFFSGLRIAAAYAMFAAIVAEWMGAERGLGVYFNRVRASYRTDRVLVAIVVIATVSVALYGAVSLAGRLATPWSARRLHPEEQR